MLFFFFFVLAGRQYRNDTISVDKSVGESSLDFWAGMLSSVLCEKRNPEMFATSAS